MSNSTTSARNGAAETISARMEAFDRLPVAARAFLAHAAFDFAVLPFKAHGLGRLSSDRLKEMEADEIGRRARIDWAPGHPQAVPKPSRRRGKARRSKIGLGAGR